MFNHKKFREIFFQATDLFKDSGTKNGAVRITPKTKLSSTELGLSFNEVLESVSMNIIETILPSETAPSRKYSSYILKNNQDKHFVTLAGGAQANKGMHFEREIHKECIEYFSKQRSESEFISSLEDQADTKFVNLIIGQDFSRSVSRPLTTEGAKRAGREIADITLVDTLGIVYPISLKGVGGKTISNNGVAGMFNKQDDKILYAGQEQNNISKPIFDSVGIDPEIISRGLTAYLNKVENNTEFQNSVVITDFEGTTLKRLIESSYDYGYYIAKQQQSTTICKLTDLTEYNLLDKHIGDIETVSIKYPFYKNDKEKRKSTNILIQTTTNKYNFEIRNCDGGVIPYQINLQQL